MRPCIEHMTTLVWDPPDEGPQFAPKRRKAPRLLYRAMRPLLLTMVLLLTAGSSGATAPNTVTGRITPSHFEFTTVVKAPEDKDEAGGWQAVCIHGRITQGDSGATSVCKFEVGLPLRNNRAQGNISLEMAQHASADMANRAIHETLSKADPTEMLSILCNNFKKTYRLMLREKIYAAEVGKCMTKGIKTVHFNVPYHCD